MSDVQAQGAHPLLPWWAVMWEDSIACRRCCRSIEWLAEWGEPGKSGRVAPDGETP